ncbi:MAG: hypothetical protein ACXVKA_02200 [Acidimicrobiia bacterium]
MLDAVDLGAHVDRAVYKTQRDVLQERLRRLSLRAREEGVSSVALFEGWDAAGKGGVIRRVSKAMDVQDYRIVPIGVPTEEELGTAGYWLSALRGLFPRRCGNAPTQRSTTSRNIETASTGTTTAAP